MVSIGGKKTRKNLNISRIKQKAFQKVSKILSCIFSHFKINQKIARKIRDEPLLNMYIHTLIMKRSADYPGLMAKLVRKWIRRTSDRARRRLPSTLMSLLLVFSSRRPKFIFGA